jgi:polysaccharide biosynthesis protein VpsM
MKAGNRLVVATILSGAGLTAIPALAQDASQYPVFTGEPYTAPSTSGSTIVEGPGGRLNGSLDALGTYSSNFYYSPDADPNKVTAWGESLQPILVYDDNMPRLRVQAAAIGTFARYDTPGGLDNFGDGTVSAGASWSPLLRDSFNLNAAFRFGHDPFGTNRTEALLPEISDRGIDEWQQQAYGLSWVHGSSSHFSSIVSLNYATRHYTSNGNDEQLSGSQVPGCNIIQRILPGTSYEDFSAIVGQATGFYAISPKTSLLLEFIGSGTNTPNVDVNFIPAVTTGPNPLPAYYSVFEPDRSSTQYQIRTGVRWLATSKLTGDVRVGAVRRDFVGTPQPANAPQILAPQPYYRVDWSVLLDWAPTRLNHITVESADRTDVSYVGNAYFIDDLYASVRWTHTWTPFFDTALTGNYVKSRFIGYGRSDDNYFGVFNATYRLNRYMGVISNLAFGRRLSNLSNDQANYNRLDAYLGLRITPFARSVSTISVPQSPVSVVPELPSSSGSGDNGGSYGGDSGAPPPPSGN